MFIQLLALQYLNHRSPVDVNRVSVPLLSQQSFPSHRRCCTFLRIRRIRILNMIYLVRHGETVWNETGRLQGRGDSPLTSKGHEQVIAVSKLLRREIDGANPIEVQSSPLERTRQTSSMLCRELGLDESQIRLSPLLIEFDYGTWDGLSFEEINRRYSNELEKRDGDKWNYVLPGGESYALVYERAKEWLKTVDSNRTTIAVTHLGTSRVIQGAYAGLSPDETLKRRHSHEWVYRLVDGRIEEIVGL